MCGRYTAAKDFTELIKLVGVIMSRVPIFGPRYNISPTQLAPVIYHERHQPAMKLMRWGLIPSWAKDESVGNAHINARSETLPSRNAFREAFKHRRCLIPADSFYEWQEREGKRQPFRVMLKSGEPFCFAGLWEQWIKPPSRENADTDLDEAPPSETIESFTIITRAANAAIAPLHDRMRHWLFCCNLLQKCGKSVQVQVHEYHSEPCISAVVSPVWCMAGSTGRIDAPAE